MFDSPHGEQTRERRARLAKGDRIYAIGDIHGRLDLFGKLIAQIRRDNDARRAARVRILLLGDLIDRGASSAELVARCRAIAARSNRFVVLKGNHEAMMVHAIRGNFQAMALWLRNGGEATLRSWGVSDEALEEGASLELLAQARARVPADTVAWLDQRPLTLRTGDYLFVHAGVRPGIALEEQSPDDLLWIRGEFLESLEDHGSVVVHGHSEEPDGVVFRAGRIGIDTGAYRTEMLTALGLEGDRRWTLATAPEVVPVGADGDTGRRGRKGAVNGGSAPDAADALDDNLAAILGMDPDASRGHRAPVAKPSRLIPALAGAAGVAVVALAIGVSWPLFFRAPPERPHRSEARSPPMREAARSAPVARSPGEAVRVEPSPTVRRGTAASAPPQIAVARRQERRAPGAGSARAASSQLASRDMLAPSTERAGAKAGPLSAPPVQAPVDLSAPAARPAPSPPAFASNPATASVDEQMPTPVSSNTLPRDPVASDTATSKDGAGARERRAPKPALSALDAIRLLRRQ